MNLPQLDAVRDLINERTAAMNTHALLDTVTLEMPEKWTLRLGVTCANGERIDVDVDLLELLADGGLLSIAEALH